MTTFMPGRTRAAGGLFVVAEGRRAQDANEGHDPFLLNGSAVDRALTDAGGVEAEDDLTVGLRLPVVYSRIIYGTFGNSRLSSRCDRMSAHDQNRLYRSGVICVRFDYHCRDNLTPGRNQVDGRADGNERTERFGV